MKSNGKVIAVLGAQATGKSTLVRKLQQNIEYSRAFYEGESFPDYVVASFTDPPVRIRAFLYFHNLWVSQYLKAEEVRQQGGTALLDAFWLTNLFYIDTLVDANEQQLIHELLSNTAKIFDPPDGIIYLDLATDQMAA